MQDLISMNWYARIDGHEYGPVAAQQLQQWALENRILATTEVRQGETGTWIQAGQVQGLLPPTVPPTLPQAQALIEPSTSQSSRADPFINLNSSGKRSRPTRRRHRKTGSNSSKTWVLVAGLLFVFGVIGAAVTGDPDVMVGAIFLLPVLAIYFLPTIIAHNREHLNLGPIFIIQLLLGWTVITWIICLAWSFSGNVESRFPRRR